MASPVLISQQPVTKASTLSYAKIVVQKHNENATSTSGQENGVNQNATSYLKVSTSSDSKNVKNRPVGRGQDVPFRQQRQQSSSDTVMKKESGEFSSSNIKKLEPSSSSQPSKQQNPPGNEGSQDQDDSSGEFETVVGKRHGHSSSMKYRDNNDVGSGKGKYHNSSNYRRRYRDRRPPFHENRNSSSNVEKPPIASKVVTNGSICSETSSNSSTDGHHASVISDDNGHVSASNSTESAGENDACDNSEETKEVKYIDAPPPAVNPWQVNSNASSVIAKIRKPPSVKDERTPPLSVLPQTFADTVSHRESGHAKIKGRTCPPAKQIEKVSTQEDWPTLEETVQQLSTLPKSAMDIKLVRFASSATESTDSGGEEITTLPRQNPLGQEKWPSISAAVESKKSSDESEEPSVICIDINETNTAGASSRDGDVSGEEPTTEENANRRKNTKASRPKWVPLSLPETGANKQKSPRRDRPVDKSSKLRPSENSDSYNGSARTVGRGGGRGTNSIGTRGGRGGHRNDRARYNNQNFHKEPYDHNNHRHGSHRDREDYTDYPPDFTTLSPIYPVSEFIMPYVTNTFVPTAFVTSPIDSTKPPYTIGQDGILTDLVKKQIEYYFSEENLDKDFYLRRKMDADGYLPVRLISSFHRVRNMTQDYGLVLTAIRLSSDLELREDMSCVRTVHDPTKWPILDSAMPPHLHPLMMPTSSGVLIPLPTAEFSNYNNNNRLSSESGELLNPNVSEFVPKSYITMPAPD